MALNGNTINIGPNDGLNGISQSYVLGHEVGHGVELSDLQLPWFAPPGAGRWSERGQRLAYGNNATNWLANYNGGDLSMMNNESYQCFVNEECGR